MATKFRRFRFFTKFCNQTNSRVLISNMRILFLKLMPKNTKIRLFGQNYPNLGIFFRKNLQFDKFDGVDFKYGNSFLKILAQKYPHKAFLVPNLGIFNFPDTRFEVAGFKYDHFIFKFHPKNTQIRHFYSQI